MRILALAAALIVPTAALATSIVAVRTSRSFIIAADSKPTYRGVPGPPKVCKIYRTGKLYFAISGLEYDKDRRFEPAQIIASKFSDTISFDRLAARVESAVKEALTKELEELRSSDPQTFRFTTKGSDITSILLAEIRRGVPHVAAREFKYSESPAPHLDVNRITCPGNCPRGNQYFFLGEQTDATQYVRDHRREVLDSRTVPAALVRLEAKSHPDDVGPPVVLLRVDNRGPHWLANESACPIVVTPQESTR